MIKIRPSMICALRALADYRTIDELAAVIDMVRHNDRCRRATSTR